MRLGLGALLLLGLGGAFLPGHVLWGLNHLAYLPRWITPIWALMAALVAWPRVHRTLARLLAGPIPHALFGTRIGPLALVLASGGLFALVRENSYFMGDGYLVGELVERGVPFRAFDNLDYLIHFHLYRKIHLLKPAFSSFTLYQISAVVAGMLGVAAVLVLLRRLKWEPWRKAAALGFFLFTGPVVLFCGYVESYSYLYVFLISFLIAGLLVLGGQAPLWVASMFFGLALAFHLTALFSAPAILYLALRANAKPAWKRWLQAGGPPIVLLGISVVCHLAAGYDAAWFRREFLESKNTRSILIPLLDYRGLFSLYHWKDQLNLLLITAPACLCVVLFRIKSLARRRGELPVQFLLVQMAGIALCSLILDRKLGGARDWDLLAAHAGGLLLLAAFVLPEHSPGSESSTSTGSPPTSEPAVPKSRRTRSGSGVSTSKSRILPAPVVGMAVGVSLLLTVPWVLLLHLEPRSITRFVDVAGDFPKFPRAYAYEEVGKYHRKAEDYAKAEEMYERTIDAFPGNARFRVLLGSVYFMREKLDEAEKEYQAALESDPENKMAKEMLGKLYLKRKDYGPAADFYAQTVLAKPNDLEIWQGYGAAALKANRLEEAVSAYRRILELSRNVKVRHTLGVALLGLKRYDEAAAVFREAIERGEDHDRSRLGLATAVLSLAGDEVRAGKSPTAAYLAEAEEQARALQRLDANDPDAMAVLQRIALLRRGVDPDRGARP